MEGLKWGRGDDEDVSKLEESGGAAFLSLLYFKAFHPVCRRTVNGPSFFYRVVRGEVGSGWWWGRHQSEGVRRAVLNPGLCGGVRGVEGGSRRLLFFTDD